MDIRAGNLLIWNFFISVFLKEKNLIMNLMTYIAMLDCFLILFAQERFPWKKAKAGKTVVLLKNFFYIKLVNCFKLMTVSI